ncbi:MAG: InlB B-repeat-containing protein [Lachnospiraceae bacterium]|nr:InlB B-repeat-containing protein [Lachnospiraceae bacterium]
MGESKQQPDKRETPQLRGLYSKVKISVRTLNIIIVVLVALLIACMAYGISKGGFRVSFDTQGGTPVEMQSGIMYGELIEIPEEPMREGFEFDGWYLDPDGAMVFDAASDPVTESMTLYAGWREK